MRNMILIVGLGNPGQKYERTRHNVGFRIIDEFAKENNFPAFVFSKKSNAEISEREMDGKKIILVKPQTFMNSSGSAVKTIAKNLKLETKDLFVINDDIDLPIGTLRISVGKNSAGHKGVQSIIDSLGTNEFMRFRIGIAPSDGKHSKTEEFVLKNFNKDEEKIIKVISSTTCNAISVALKENVERAMNEFNK